MAFGDEKFFFLRCHSLVPFFIPVIFSSISLFPASLSRLFSPATLSCYFFIPVISSSISLFPASGSAADAHHQTLFNRTQGDEHMMAKK
jgi:hypothetical protein